MAKVYDQIQAETRRDWSMMTHLILRMLIGLDCLQYSGVGNLIDHLISHSQQLVGFDLENMHQSWPQVVFLLSVSFASVLT